MKRGFSPAGPLIFLVCVLVPVLIFGQDPGQYGAPFPDVPDPRDAVIYQVNIRSFSEAGNLQGVTARLDNISGLGVNVLYLMPVFPVGQLNAVNSPYCVSDYMSVNPEFGSLEDLRALVDGAHARGMAVILDWVANHTAWDHPWAAAHPSWYLYDGGGNIINPNGWTDVVQLDFGNQEMRAEIIAAMHYWVFAANVDGFRCDYADGPPIDFWEEAISSLQNISTHKLILMAEGGRSSNFQFFHYNFGFSFFDRLKAVFLDNLPASSMEEINTSSYEGASENNRVVRYTTNHDVNSSDGTPLELFGGIPGSLAAFTTAAYMKGVPMIYNGQEVGTPFRLLFPFTESSIDWSLNPGLVSTYTELIGLYNSSPAIRRGSMTSFSNDDVCAFFKVFEGDSLFAVSNLRNAVASISIPAFLSGAAWREAFSNATVALENEISLGPYEYRVFRNHETTAVSSGPAPVSDLSSPRIFFAPDGKITLIGRTGSSRIETCTPDGRLYSGTD